MIFLIALICLFLLFTFVILYLFYAGFILFAFYGVVVLSVLVVIFFILVLIQMIMVIFKGNAPYVRSSQKLIYKIINEVDFEQGKVIYELGCGDGRFIRSLLKHKDLKGVGIEYDLIPYVLANVFTFFSRNKAKIIFGDFFKKDLSEADYIFTFLITEEQIRLEEKLQKELKPGALVISNTFQFKNWQPKKVLTVFNDSKKRLSNKIYVYEKGERG